MLNAVAILLLSGLIGGLEQSGAARPPAVAVSSEGPPGPPSPAMGRSEGSPGLPRPETTGRTEILVAAAVSLKEVLDEAAARFEMERPDVGVALDFAASGILLKQIEQGAPVDLFISASASEIDHLEKEGLIAAGSRKTLASNSLVAIVPTGSVPPASLARLAENRFDRIAVGNPSTVPAGRYAQEALASLGLLDILRPRFVFGESVRQVLEYVARGEASAGLVYGSDARAAEGRIVLGAKAPPESHSPILYQSAITSAAPHAAIVNELLEFLLSGGGQRLFLSHGFLPPPAR